MSARSNYKRSRKAALAPYRSQYEADIAKDLEARGILFEFEPRKVKYFYPIKGGICSTCNSAHVARAATYLPDFWLPEQGLWLEAKGLWTGPGRTKTMAVLETSGVIRADNFRIIFQRNQFLTKAKKKSYTQWCAAQGIVCVVGTQIPVEWERT